MTTPTPASHSQTAPLATPNARTQTGPGTTATEAIRTALRLAMAGWAEAWSKRDSVAYLATMPKTSPRPTARAPICGAKPAGTSCVAREDRAQASKMDIRIDGNQAQVHFTQDLEQGGQRSSERRTLVFGKRNGEWLIIRSTAERSPVFRTSTDAALRASRLRMMMMDRRPDPNRQCQRSCVAALLSS